MEITRIQLSREAHDTELLRCGFADWLWMTLVSAPLRPQHPQVSVGAYNIYLAVLLWELKIVNEWHLVQGGTQQRIITIVLSIFSTLDHVTEKCEKLYILQFKPRCLLLFFPQHQQQVFPPLFFYSSLIK